MITMIKDKKIKLSLKTASQTLGINENDLFERALVFYLHAIKDKIALKREFDALDKLSDEAFIGMNL